MSFWHTPLKRPGVMFMRKDEIARMTLTDKKAIVDKDFR
jgi:hypothetical protein